MDSLLLVLLNTSSLKYSTMFILFVISIVIYFLCCIYEDRMKQKTGKLGKSYAFDIKGMNEAHDAICKVFGIVLAQSGNTKLAMRATEKFFCDNYEQYTAGKLLKKIRQTAENGNFNRQDMEKAFYNMKEEFPDPKHREKIMNTLCIICDLSNNKNNTMALIMDIAQNIGVMNGKVEDNNQ